MLFRKEVIEQLGQGQAEGRVLIRTPWLLWFFSVTAFVASCGLLLVIFTGTYTQRVRITGHLNYDQAPMYVRTDVPGRLNKLLVENGRHVKKGQVICIVMPGEAPHLRTNENSIRTSNRAGSQSIEQRLQEQDLLIQNLNARVQQLSELTQGRTPQTEEKKKANFETLKKDAEGELLAIEILSPIDGILQFDESLLNTQLQAGSAVFAVIPEGSRLRAELAFPASALPYVQNGISLNLRYSAFPYQKFGQYQGTLIQVSNAMVGTSSNSSGEKQYIAYVVLSQQEVTAYGKPVPLRAGLEVEADYPTAQRNIVEWIFEPLLALKGHL